MVTGETTTIKLHKSTVEDLKKRGEMGESYEDVILKLLKKVRSKNQE